MQPANILFMYTVFVKAPLGNVTEVREEQLEKAWFKSLTYVKVPSGNAIELTLPLIERFTTFLHNG